MSDVLLGSEQKPAILVIFGITGNLAKLKLLPALYHLVKDNRLHPQTIILGASRRPVSVDELLKTVEVCVLEEDNVCDPEALKDLQRRLRMYQIDPEQEADYDGLLAYLNSLEDETGMCMDRLYYLSVPPAVYPAVVHHLGVHGLNASCQHGNATTRLLVEKPFGHDVASAETLIAEMAEQFEEDQVFRIDHYLAKESAQNILTFRRHNPVFMDSWNGRHISQIKVLAHEQIGIAGRVNFYDQVGALRDLVQSHLLQLLTLVMLDLAKDDDDIALHQAKAIVLDSLSPVDVGSIVRGQYNGYTSEVDNPDSRTETYVRLNLTSDLLRWQGTDILIETGKSLDTKKTEIQIVFHEADETGNRLTFRIQPNEGIDLQLTAKKPGFGKTLQKVSMDFSYHGVFEDPKHPDAYERVLVDALNGDHSLFATSDEVMASWRVLQPILDYWQANNNLLTYEPGSRGPANSAE